jgi:hypothetical protein
MLASSSNRFSIDVGSALGRPVLDALRFIEHDHVRLDRAHLLEVPEELLITDDQEAPLESPVLRCAIRRSAVHDAGRHIGRVFPFAEPLRLERRRHDQHTPLDDSGVEEPMARRHRLCRLAEAHVVGEQKPPRPQEALDALALVGVELALQRRELRQRPFRRSASLRKALGTCCLLDHQRLRGGLAGHSALDQPPQQREALPDVAQGLCVERAQGRTAGRLERSRRRAEQPPGAKILHPALDHRLRVGPRTPQLLPHLHPTRGDATANRDPESEQTIEWAGERYRRIPPHDADRERAAARLLALGRVDAFRRRAHVVEHGEQVLAQPERAPHEVRATTAPAQGHQAREQRLIRPQIRMWRARRVDPEHALGPLDDSQPVALTEAATAVQSIERGALERPVAGRRAGDDLRGNQLSGHLAVALARALAQCLECFLEALGRSLGA